MWWPTMTSFLMLAAVLCGTDAPIVGDAVCDEQGFRIHRVTSEFQRGETLIRVLLPDQLEPGRCLPVLYLLPVEAGTEKRYGDGLIEAQRLNLANRYRLICVAPTFSHLPWYADHPSDRLIRQESYFLQVVVPSIEQRYPVAATRNGRWLVGFSKSGYGAWSLLLRNSTMFAQAAAWDAPLMQAAPDRFGMGPIYGTADNFERYRIERVLRDRAKDDHSNGRCLIHLGYGNFRDHHQRAEALLQELKLPHVYADGPKREHTWHSGWLEEAVKALATQDLTAVKSTD
jgi:hypothetical protein